MTGLVLAGDFHGLIELQAAGFTAFPFDALIVCREREIGIGFAAGFHMSYQCCAEFARCFATRDSHSPRLHVVPRRGVLRYFQYFFDGLARHLAVLKFAATVAGYYGLFEIHY